MGWTRQGWLALEASYGVYSIQACRLHSVYTTRPGTNTESTEGYRHMPIHTYRQYYACMTWSSLGMRKDETIRWLTQTSNRSVIRAGKDEKRIAEARRRQTKNRYRRLGGNQINIGEVSTLPSSLWTIFHRSSLY